MRRSDGSFGGRPDSADYVGVWFNTMGCMPIKVHNPVDVFPPYVNYAHAVEVPADTRTLYVSGLNGFELDASSLGDQLAGLGKPSRDRLNSAALGGRGAALWRME